jgi:hypothetical protein
MGRTTSFPNFIWHYTCVPGEIGIRGSKDLRAGLRKYLSPTNERKQMSTKTIKQRIALVAVSALTAGLFSVVSAPVANAAIVAQGGLNIATTNSTTGAAIVTAGGGDTAADRSLGFVAVTSADGTNQVAVGTTGRHVKAGTTGTANALAGAQIVASVQESTAGGAGNAVVITVSGGTVGGAVSDSGAMAYDGTNTAVSSATAATVLAARVTANPGTTSMTISAYEGTAVTAAAPTTGGTLLGRWVITIVSASVSGVVSVADSTLYIGASQAKGTACTASPNNTAPTFDNFARIDNGRVACIRVALADAYGLALGSTGSLQASATGGSLVEIGGAAADAYTASLSFDSDTYATAGSWISVLQPVSNAAGSTTVTITYQGVVLGTKTLNWNGIASAIELDTANSVSTFNAGASSEATVLALTPGSKLGIVYRVKDAAGNNIAFASTPTIADATGSMISATLDATGNATENVPQTVALGRGRSTMYIGNSSVTGAGTYKLSITNSAGTVIKSPAYNATVVGSVATFVASWDKASYTPGEIATLTIKGLDSAGRGAADGTLLGTGTVISVNTDGFGHLTSTCETTPATSSGFLGGQKTCKFAVKNTPGSYSYSVKVASSTSQAETTGTLAVVASSATVTNADVLKSIVSLIASINKQIQALQKLILRR